MKRAKFNYSDGFNPEKAAIKLVLETSFSKEIQISMKKGQIMKEHTAPFPIIVHLLDGRVEFRVSGKSHPLVIGDILTLEARVPHDLEATEDSVIRLTLSKHDHEQRVKTVTEL